MVHILEEETESQSNFYFSFCYGGSYLRSLMQNATIRNTVAEENFYCRLRQHSQEVIH